MQRQWGLMLGTVLLAGIVYSTAQNSLQISKEPVKNQLMSAEQAIDEERSIFIEEPDLPSTVEKPIISSEPKSRLEDEEQSFLIVKKQEGEEVDVAERLFETGFNKEKKKQDVIALVDKAIDYFSKHSFTESCYAFTHSDRFFLGELYIFVMDTKGTTYAYGERDQPLWKNHYKEVDQFGYSYTQRMITLAQSGGGWISHGYRDTVRHAYVKSVFKDDKTYIIGSGFYSHSKQDVVTGLVRGAVAFFNEGIKQEKAPSELFSNFSYPLSHRFVVGDLYLFALDFQGNIVAQGDRPGLIGTNAWDYQDTNGLYTNREIVKKLQEVSPGDGVWIEYVSKRAPKQVYAEQVADKEGKKYFIACGYYPDADKQQAKELVSKGFQYLKSHGIGTAAEEFSSKQNDTFRYGDLYLFLYDMNGKVIAHGSNSEFIGKNHIDLKDDEGDFYVKEVITKLQGDNQNVLMNHRIKNAFQSIYAEKVSMGTGDYIVGCGFYPLTKRETMMLLVKSAAEFLTENPLDGACRQFSLETGVFLRGDLSIFVIDEKGVCYVWGDRLNYVWKNIYDWKDDDGKFFIQRAIQAVEHGPAKVAFKLHHRFAVAHVEKVVKDGKIFIIGSHFYL